MFSRFLHLPKSLLVCLLFQDVAGVLGDSTPYHNDQKFDNGEYGAYPMQKFHSSNVVAPKVNVLSTHPSCDDGSYVMLNPRGYKVPDDARGPVILDNQGNLVWAATGYEQTYDLMAQEYQGKQYLTFWSGNDAIGGHGNGQYIMVNSSYNEVGRISAANKLWGDLHEFRFTEQGTALLTVYDVHPVDLRPLGGPEDGYVWDSVFQEMDIESGEAVFQWRASDHYTVTDSYHPRGDDGANNRPYDFFHINSVEKDPQGNYLISSRYMSSVTYIDGKTGDIIWILGGKRNQFVDLSDGRATDFLFQHDARWSHDFSMITLFANGDAPGQSEKASYSRAMSIRIDTSNSTHMTAKLETQYIDNLELLSSSQGSAQVLPNGNVLVGYGFTSAFTEFAPNGVALCETHFGSRNRFGSGDVQSYRVMKFNWTATPLTSPSMAIISDKIYVSWNGATEVREWALETGEKRARTDEIKWKVTLKTGKRGFETEITLPSRRGTYIRVVAIDRDGKSIGVTRVIEIPQAQASVSGDDSASDYSTWSSVKHSNVLRFVAFCISMICLAISVSWLVNALRRWWKSRRYSGYSEVPRSPMQQV